MMCNGSVVTRCVLVTVSCLVFMAGSALAYETYSASRDDTNCRACHGSFRSSPYVELGTGISWGDDLHDLHRNGMLSGDCNTCHKGNKFPVRLGDSDGGFKLDAISCSGCHGRAADGTGTGSLGFGAGLRQKHWRSGETICADCHSDADPAGFTPVGEDVPPPYYLGSSHPAIPKDTCNDPTNALTPEEDMYGAARGLDNDGDGDYDTLDTDCGAVVQAPGEPSGSTLALMQVTANNPAAMLLSLTYGVACGTSDHAILYGPLTDVGAYNYTGGSCSMGNSGTMTDWSYAGAPDSFFFLLVADNDTAEGSYGLKSNGAERPSDDLLVPPVCPLAQDLPNRCD